MKITSDSCHRDFNGRFLTAVVRIRYDRRRAGDIGLDPIRRGRSLHDIPNSLDGFVRHGLALVPGEIQLNIRSLAVGALRSRRRQRVPPEILDVLHVRRVGVQLTN